MLPALSSLRPSAAPWLKRVLLAPLLCLCLALSGCGGPGQPPRAVLLQALSLQIQITQAQVAAALALEPAGLPQVSRVRVEQQEAIAIGDGRGLHLSGRFDWRLAQDPIRVDSAFDLYLIRGERSQGWRLARPVGSADGLQQDWISEPLPLAGESARPSLATGPVAGTGGAG